MKASQKRQLERLRQEIKRAPAIAEQQREFFAKAQKEYNSMTAALEAAKAETSHKF